LVGCLVAGFGVAAAVARVPEVGFVNLVVLVLVG
jgi:hypothetical protein